MEIFTENRIRDLVVDLETWNTSDKRKAAIHELSMLKIPHVSVILALQRHLKEHNELNGSISELLEKLLMINKIKQSKQSSRPVQVVTNVTIEEINTHGEIEGESEIPYRRCNFCSKETTLRPAAAALASQLSGANNFYCTFCLRHKFNTKNGRNTLMLSFRGLIGYYYYAFYTLPKVPIIYLNQLNDFINLHVEIGKQNPLFFYDEESYLWFIDFSRIGKIKGQLPIEEVLKTISEIIMSFGLFDYIKDVKPHLFYKKYEEAVQIFYHQRKRPDNARILSPTLVKTGAAETAPEKPYVLTLAYAYNNYMGGDTRTT
jgi:hypothetical protein